MQDGFHIEIEKRVVALCERVRANHEAAQRFAFYLEYIIFHMPAPRIDPALCWLVKNELTGDRFLDFVDDECNGSPLELIRHLTMRLEREKETRALHRSDLQ